MYYPEDFISRVKEAFPSDPVMHRMLVEGDRYVGPILCENARPRTFSIGEILTAYSLEELKRVALDAHKKEKACSKLYDEWNRLYEQQCPK